jgi:hypothetical protein
MLDKCSPCKKKLIGALVLLVLLGYYYCQWSVGADGHGWLFEGTHASKSHRRLMTKDDRHGAFGRLLSGVGRALDKDDITWMISFGTLLGWHREHDFIEWDDDVDTICFVEDSEAIVAALKKHTDFIVTDRAHHMGRIMATDPVTRIQLDIFLFEEIAGNVYRQYTLLGRLSWPTHGKLYFGHGMFFPLRRTQLNRIPVIVPNKPAEFLEMRYGPTYMIPDPETDH